MKAWLTASEFAELAAAGLLTGLPTTKRGMNLLIARERWDAHEALCRRRTGREGGGGTEFHIDILPLSTRLAYAARQVPRASRVAAVMAEHEQAGHKRKETVSR